MTDEAVEATCTETGLTAGSHCEVCDETIVAQEEIPALGHNWGDWNTVYEPTCVNNGLKTRSCSNTGCSDPYEDEVIPATGAHIFNELIYYSADNNQHYFVCEQCYSERKYVDCTFVYDMPMAGSYDPATGTHTVMGKCKVCENTDVKDCDGTWKEVDRVEGSCTVGTVLTYSCSACGTCRDETLEAPGHEYGFYQKYNETQHWNLCGICQSTLDAIVEDCVFEGDWYVLNAATEFEAGIEAQYCRCGNYQTREIDPTHTHNYVGEVTTEPTCTEEGVKTYTCTCNEGTYTESISATGHRWSGLVVTSATCTVDGYITITCGDCGKVAVSGQDAEADQYLIDYPFINLGVAKGHDIVVDEAVEATCTEDGLTEGKHCTRCDDATVAQEVVPALGHSKTFGENGEIVCANCGEAMTAYDGLNFIDGAYYLYADGRLADTEETGELYDWNVNYKQLIMSKGQPAVNGVYTINDEKIYVVFHKPADELYYITDKAVAEELDITVDAYYLFADGKLADTEETGERYDWNTNYKQLIMSKGQPAANGVYTIGGEKVYVVSHQKADGLHQVTEQIIKELAGEGIWGKFDGYYVFQDGKLANGENLKWNDTYNSITLINGQPA